MLRLARSSGDARPESIRAVRTTQARGLRVATPGDTIPGSSHRCVYLVVLKGNFTVDASVPSGARLPTGKYLAVTVGCADFQGMDLGIGSNQGPPMSLRRLGPVTSLYAAPVSASATPGNG